MKRTLLAGGVLLLSLGAVRADTHVEELNGRDRFVLGVHTEHRVESTSELWISETRVAYRTPGRIFLVDRVARTFTVVNTNTRSYVTTPLPIELSRVLADDLAERYRHRRWSGTVEETDETAELLGRTARRYDVVFFAVEDGRRTDRQEVRVWASTDADVDGHALEDLMVPLRAVLNRDAALCDQLARIPGVQLKVEWEERGIGTLTRHFTLVGQIDRREPPPGVYDPPADFTRKDRLTTEDF